MNIAPWAEGLVALGLLGLAALARLSAAGPIGGDGEARHRAELLAAELAWAALLASSLILGTHALLGLAPGLGSLIVLTLAGFAALVVADRVPSRIGQSAFVPRGGRSPKGPVVSFLARPFRSLAGHLARQRAARPADEPAADHEEKLLHRLLDATTNGEVGEDGETAILRQLLGGMLRLRETPVASIMCPRSRIVWIGHRERPAAAALLMRESGHSRIPVCGRDLDDVVGVLHLKDAFLALHGVSAESTVGAIAREPVFVTDETPLSDLLGNWRHQSGTMSIVRDPLGRVVGLVTLRDVLEWLMAAHDAAGPGIATAGSMAAGGVPPASPPD